MTTITLNENFEDLLSGLGDSRLPDFTLDYMALIDNFSLRSDLIVEDPTLSASSLTVVLRSLDDTDPVNYTFRVSGSGAAFSGTLDDLEAAIEQGTANGTLTQISVDYGPLRIAAFDIAPESLTFTSGNQSLELTGGFPVTLSQLITLADIIGGDAEGSLDAYGFTGFTLRDGDDVLVSLQTGDNLTLSIDGYTLTLTGAEISVEELFEFFDPPREQIVPVLRLFDNNGDEVAGLPYSFGDDEPNMVRVAFENLPSGTYYAAISADSTQFADWQTQTGVYQLTSNYFGNVGDVNQWTFENAGDAPANTTTPYILNSGASFFGAVDTVGDVDWIRIEFPKWNSTYTQNNADFSEGFTFSNALVLQAFGTGQAEPMLSDLAGFSFETLVIRAPGGEEILRADGVESFEDFLRELDLLLTPFEFPSLADLELAFATGDPHLLTHDGLGYDFHAAGEYVLVRATDGSDFEVQARMSPAGENVTANIAAAVQLDGGKVMINAHGTAAVRVNGAAQEIADQSMVFVGDDRIYRDGDTYILVHTRDGSMDTGYSAVVVTLVGTRVDIGVALDPFWMGQVEGLLGNFNGDSSDDLVLADGTPLTREPGLVFGDDPENDIWGVYGQFREDWRVTEETTLFNYAAGEGPDSFYLPDYPTRMITLDDFSTDDRIAAEQQAEDAGLTPGTFAFNNAVLDLLLTGDESYLESAKIVNTAIEQRISNDPTAIVTTPEVAGGELQGLLTVSGQLKSSTGDDLTGATVTFRPAGSAVNLTRLTHVGNEFEFEMGQNASGQLDATRAYDTAIDPRITAMDALDVLRIAVGLAPSFGEATAQNFIAADINGDGRVTAQDALEVLRAAVGLNSEFAPRWVFFDADTDLNDLSLSRSNTTVETGVSLANLTENTSGVDMQGILLGNMEAVI